MKTDTTRFHLQTPNDLLAKIDRLADLEHGTRTGVILRIVSRGVESELAAWPKAETGRTCERCGGAVRLSNAMGIPEWQCAKCGVSTFNPAEITIEEAQDRLRRSRERAGLDADTGLPIARAGRGSELAGKIALAVTSGERRLDPGDPKLAEDDS